MYLRETLCLLCVALCNNLFNYRIPRGISVVG